MMDEDTSNQIKTMDELREEWGLERYIPALREVSRFRLAYPDPVSEEDLRRFMVRSPDGWEVYRSYMLHGLDRTAD